MYECYEIDCPYCDGQQCCMEDEPYGNCVMCEDEEVEMEEEYCLGYDTTQHMMEFLNWFLENYKVDVDFAGMIQKEFVETVFASYCIANNVTEVM